MQKYIINTGNFEASNESDLHFNFKGESLVTNDPLTKQKIEQSMYGDILFGNFSEGIITFDVLFKEVFLDTRAGIILNYRNQNGEISCYQVGIKNQYCGYAVDYFNGKSWEFKVSGGAGTHIQPNVTYSICVKVYGSKIALEINGIKVLEYTNFITNFPGAWGIYICNGAEAKIDKIKVNIRQSKVFCVMKFESDFNELYQDVIKPQCEQFGLQAIRADEYYTSTPIISDITRDISEASIIICDITMDNPNVFYELGYAHALQKTTILLADKEKRKQLPFDISGYRTIFYSNTIAGKKQIEEALCGYIETIVGQIDAY